MKQKKYWGILFVTFIVILVTGSSTIPFVPGLSQPEPVGPFLNGVFPDVAESGEDYRIAFPNLSFDSPLTFTPVPNSNRLIVGQRDGKIYWFENNESTSQKNLLHDMSNEVGVVWDGGFLGLAVHPNFGQSGKNFLYLFYTTKDGQGRDYPDGFISGFGCNREDYWGGFLILKRIEVNPATMGYVPNSDLVMMKMRMFSSTHRGGGMTFGKDGFLYIPTGDQSAYSKPQNITTNLDGGVLRIDVDQDPSKSHQPIRKLPAGGRFSDEISGVGYGIPNDNPFLSSNGANFEEYYTIGHRNPHRMTMDRLTGSFYIGEIGESRHEEINVIEKGKNYGWPVYEGNYFRGTGCTSLLNGMSHEGPLVSFPRSEANAVIGGYVYRGSAMPEHYGKYICADYGTGEEIWAVDPITGNYEVITQFSPTNIISFGEDSDGELYLLSQGNNVRLYKMVQGGELEGAIPQLLSQTGAFDNLQGLEPATGVLPYELIESFWSDGAEKFRWMAIPNNGTHNTPQEQINFSEDGDWIFPVGSVLIKHFELPLDENNPNSRRRLETRFSVKASNGAFYFLTYKWNQSGTDAVLLESGMEENIPIRKTDGSVQNQIWTYPSTQDCISCHNPITGGTLGVRTRYLNSDYTYSRSGVTSNQLVTLSHLGILNQAIDESTAQQYQTYKAINDLNADLDEKARSYLDLNCAYCHRPGGTGDRAQFDLRLSNSFEQTGLLTAGTNTPIGIPGERMFVTGSASSSIFYHRINSIDQNIMMPPLAKNKVHVEAVALIEDWINRMGTDPDDPFADCTGPVMDHTDPVGSGVIRSRADFIPAEDRFKAFDNRSSPGDFSKWLDDGGVPSTSSPSWISIGLGTPRNVRLLAITSANDDFGRDPEDFRLLGSNGGGFEELGSWSGVVFPNRYERIEFELTSPGQYETYRLEITKNDGGVAMTQLSEIELLGCEVGPVAVTGVSVAPTSLELVEGGTGTLTAEVLPVGATERGVTWSSGDQGIATVSPDGTVTGVSQGTAVVTATTVDGAFTGTATVSVAERPPLPDVHYRINVSGGTVLATDDGPDWVAGAPSGFQQMGFYTVSSGNTTSGTSGVDFSVRDTSIPPWMDAGTYVSLFTNERWDPSGGEEMGYSFEVPSGSYRVNVYLGNFCSCTDGAGERIFSIELEGTVVEQGLDLSARFGHRVGAMLGYEADVSDGVLDLRFLHQVENPLVNAIEIVSMGGADSIPVTGVSISPSSLELTEGGTGTLTAEVLPNGATEQGITWSSDNDGVMVVAPDGTITGVSEGTAIITATTVDGGFTATSTVTVVSVGPIPATGVSVTPLSLELVEGGTGTLTAEVLPNDATEQGITWSSDNESVAIVTPDGMVTGLTEGTAIITVTTLDGGFTATSTVTVISVGPIPVTGVSVTPLLLELDIGDTQVFTVEVLPNDATEQGVTWSSDDEGVAVISFEGIVTGLSQGTAIITATTIDGGYTSSVMVTVLEEKDCTGPVMDHTDPVGSGVIRSRADFIPAEDRFKAFDNRSSPGDFSKWLDDGGVPSTSSPSWISIGLGTPRNVRLLAITSANDDFGRDPEDFRLLGSNGGGFEELGSWSGVVFPNRYERIEFELTSPG